MQPEVWVTAGVDRITNPAKAAAPNNSFVFMDYSSSRSWPHTPADVSLTKERFDPSMFRAGVGNDGVPNAETLEAASLTRDHAADSPFIRSKPIQEGGEIGASFAAVSVCDKRLPFVTISFEWNSPIQKMNVGSERIRHRQVHLPDVSAKYGIRQCVEITGQSAVDRLKVRPSSQVDGPLGFGEEFFTVSDRQRLKSPPGFG